MHSPAQAGAAARRRRGSRALAALVVVVLVRVDLAADLTTGPSLSVDVGIGRAGPNGLQRLGEVARRDPLRSPAWPERLQGRVRPVCGGARGPLRHASRARAG